MAKILIIGDTHFGARNGDPQVAAYQYRVFDEFIFPLIDQLQIKHVIQTGDFFDSRKHIRHDTMEWVRTKIIPRTHGQTWYIPPGNHDMHRRESIRPNSCEELLSWYPNFNIYNDPTTVEIEGVKFDMIPWICRDNRQQVMDFIKKSNTSICVGHFELAGFEYYRGMKSEGEKADFLSGYSNVISGHFHTISSGANVQYVGTPYQLTFGDADDDRGVWLFDTDTKKFSLVLNCMPRFTKIYFDHNTFDTTNLDRFADMMVKIDVKDRGDAKAFDKLIEKITKIAESVSVRDVADVSSATDATDGGTISNVKSVSQIMDSFVDNLDEDDDIRHKVKVMVQSMFGEATRK